MERLAFTSTRLRYSGKQGILKPDADGYFELPIGAFNCVNSLDEVYTMENIKDIFDSSSELMRKISNGKLFGEWGHPEPVSGEAERDFMNRACRINDKDTCAFFKEIWLDDKVANSMSHVGVPTDAVVTMAKVKPMGNKWEALQRSLEDPNVNTTFSGRFLTRDRQYRGKTYVIVERIVTWDAVTEQGIPAAEKWLSPRLESHRTVITPKLIESMKKNLATTGFRQESNDGVRDVIKCAESFFAQQKSNGPGYNNW